MTSPFNSFMTNTFAPPVMEARNWLENTKLPDNLELMNLSQAAPVDPPPLEIREAIADASLNRPETHLYGPVLGNDDLRLELSQKCSTIYNGDIKRENIAITNLQTFLLNFSNNVDRYWMTSAFSRFIWKVSICKRVSTIQPFFTNC